MTLKCIWPLEVMLFLRYITKISVFSTDREINKFQKNSLHSECEAIDRMQGHEEGTIA